MEKEQTPLRTAIMRLMSDMLDSGDEHGIFETGRFMDRIEQLLCDMMAAPEVMQLSGSEAVMGFLAWLTTRDETTVLGPSEVVDISLYERFVETNHLKEPRAGWDMLLTHPPELAPDPAPKVDEEISCGIQESILEELRSLKTAPKLDHDFSDFFKFDLEDGCPTDAPAPREPLDEDEASPIGKCFAFLDGKMVAKGSLKEVLAEILKSPMP